MPVPILSYHQTSEPPPRGVPYRDLVLAPAQFARQMQALHRHGYRGLSLGELEPYLRGERSGKVVGLTLDDGYLGNFEHALPVLESLRFTATAFVVSGRIGSTNLWDRCLGVPTWRLMDRTQLRAWLAAGMEVGAHTRHHVDLTVCSTALAQEQIRGSRDDLRQALGCEVRSFCYPYGRYRDPHVQWVAEAGYTLATTCLSARARVGADLLQLPRITVRATTPLPILLAKVLAGISEWRRWGRDKPWLVGPGLSPRPGASIAQA